MRHHCLAVVADGAAAAGGAEAAGDAACIRLCRSSYRPLAIVPPPEIVRPTRPTTAALCATFPRVLIMVLK